MNNLDKLYPSMQDKPAAPTSDPDAALAAKLFDHPTSPHPKPAASDMLTRAQPPAPDPLADAGKSLYPSMQEQKPFVDSNAPDEVKALREADGERRMFSPQKAYATDLSVADFESVEGEGITPEVREQAAATFREIAADFELPPVEVRELVTIFKAPRPSEEVQAANRSVAMKWLVDQHGDRAGFALEAAQALVARDPRVAALLDHSGAGDDVRVVQKIVGAALRQVQSGKLKVGKR